MPQTKDTVNVWMSDALRRAGGAARATGRALRSGGQGAFLAALALARNLDGVAATVGLLFWMFVALAVLMRLFRRLKPLEHAIS